MVPEFHFIFLELCSDWSRDVKFTSVAILDLDMVAEFHFIFFELCSDWLRDEKFSNVVILDLDLVPEFHFICNWHRWWVTPA